MVVIVGASFTLVTVKVNELLDANKPSLTPIVTVQDPNAFATGFKVAVRLGPVPLRTILPMGRSVESEEVAVTVKPASGVSTSPIVNETDVGVSSSVLR